MAGEYTKVSYKRKPGFLQRMGRSAMGVFLGAFLLLLSFFILYHNEGRSVAIQSMLEDGLKKVIPLGFDKFHTFQSKLVHHSGELLTGDFFWCKTFKMEVDVSRDYATSFSQDEMASKSQAHGKESLSDLAYPISVKCVKLKRIVEMYQWVEHSELREIDEGDEIRQETIYTYDREWSTVLHKSQSFAEELGHQNPRLFPEESKSYSADFTTLDGVRLSRALLENIDWYERVDLHPLPNRRPGVSVHQMSYYYHGTDPHNPQVGDYRVSFMCAGRAKSSNGPPADIVSVVAMVSGSNFAPYPVNGRSIELLRRGSHSAEEMFSIEKSANTNLTWLIRVGGCALMYIALSIMTRLIVTVVDWIPVVRGIVSWSVAVFNITLAVCLTMVTVAICWLRFRPLFATSLLAASALPWILTNIRAKSVA